MEARSEQDQRPQRRRDKRRDDVGHGGQVGVVRILMGDDDAEQQIREQGQMAHSIVLRRASRRSSPIDVGVNRDADQPARVESSAVLR